MSKFLFAVVVFISVILLGSVWGWAGFREDIETVSHIAVVLGGFYALMLAERRAKAADEQASAAMKQADTAMKQAGAAMKQVDISSQSSQAQRYEKAAEMLWHPEEVGIREAGCYALKSLGGRDVDMAMQCRDLLVSFVRHSSPTSKRKAERQELQYRLDILAADHALSSLYRKWHDQDKFTTFSLKYLPNGFWRIAEPISHRDYRGANLFRANLTNAELGVADLSGADLSVAELNEAKLNEAKLNGAKLNGARLNKANLIEADLSSADLSGAGLCGADLSDADLNKANLSEANLSGAIFFGADLNGANLFRAKLNETKLSAANLNEANLTAADLSGADLSGVNISKADFKGDSKEDGAKKLTKEQIESAVWDRKFGPPLLPDYLSNVDVDKMGHPRG